VCTGHGEWGEVMRTVDADDLPWAYDGSSVRPHYSVMDEHNDDFGPLRGVGWHSS
jgi:hypothetical protein